ncbi:MAG: site-specific integrase [Rhodospirillaceae bacterium]
MQAKVTKSLLNQLKPGPADVWVWDTILKGFGLRITPSDVRTYWVKYRMGGRESTTRKFKIGTHGTITPDQARTQAEQVLANIRLGVDPSAEREVARQPKKANHLVSDDVESFFEKNAAQLKSGGEIRRVFTKDILPSWKDRETKSIRKPDVLDLIDSIVESGRPVHANRAFAMIRKFFNWCIERGIVETTPCSGVKAPTVEQSRERVHDDDELRRIWNAAGKMAYPFGPWIRLLILTGQRRDEVAGMRWSELDETGMWTLPGERTKNGRVHKVPLPCTARDILAGLPRDGSDFVFTTTGRTAISGYSKAKAAIDTKIIATMKEEAEGRGENPAEVKPLPQWGFHDFRRTITTNLVNMRIPAEVADKVLNHVSGKIQGVAAVYNRYEYMDERRQALEAWASRIEKIVSGTPANVVTLAAARKGRG